MKTLLACLAVMAAFNVTAQSRWNNYFIAHFESPGSPSADLVDSLASELGMHSTFQVPFIGGGYGSIPYPHEIQDIRGVVEYMTPPYDSLLARGRLIALGNSNGGVTNGQFDVVVYEPVYSSQLSWLHFQALAADCVDADYYHVDLPSQEAVQSALMILAARPNFENEHWYINYDGYALVSDECMEYGFSCPASTSTNSCSSGFDTQATGSLAGFLENIAGQSWFPMVLDLHPNAAGWNWDNSSAYDLGQTAPSASCYPDAFTNGPFWQCDTVVVACPDLDGNNYVGSGDLLQFLPQFGDSIDCTPNPLQD